MTPLPASPSLLLQLGFVLFALALVGGFALRLKSRAWLIGGLLWFALTGVIAATGWLSDFSGMPPRIGLALLPIFIGAAVLAFSSPGQRLAALPTGFLIGFQSFRILVELLIHQAVVESVAPPQMTWTGLNLDILSGITALALLPFIGRLPRWALLIWNTLGLGLLLWVIGVAMLSFPVAWQQLSPANIWVAHFPFFWLPSIMVFAAILGHLVLYRKLLGEET